MPAESSARRKNSHNSMNGAEEHTSAVKRRYERCEIDTELLVNVHGADERAAMRGRSLNISEAGIAGVFVMAWDIGTPVHLEFSVPVTSSPGQGWRGPP